MLGGCYVLATSGKSEETSRRMLTLGTGKLYLRLLFLRENDPAGESHIMLTKQPGFASDQRNAEKWPADPLPPVMDKNASRALLKTPVLIMVYRECF